MAPLTTQPLWLSAFLLIGATTLLAMLAPVLVRRRVPTERLRINNEVAGFTFAIVGVLYAVLLAFAVIVVWEKFNEAEHVEAQEAGAAATLYRLANGIGGDPGKALRDSLTGYLRAAVEEDWPAMEQSRSSHKATRALDATYTALLTFTPSDGRATALLNEALRQLDSMTEARHRRIVLASGAVTECPLGRALRRCGRDNRVYAVLWHREPTRAGTDDGHPIPADLLGIACDRRR